MCQASHLVPRPLCSHLKVVEFCGHTISARLRTLLFRTVTPSLIQESAYAIAKVYTLVSILVLLEISEKAI